METARLRILELKAQLAGDRITLADLASEVKIAEDLVAKGGRWRPTRLEKAEAQHDALGREHRRECRICWMRPRSISSQAQQRLDDYAGREAFIRRRPRVLWNPRAKRSLYKKGLMKEVSAQLDAIDAAAMPWS